MKFGSCREKSCCHVSIPVRGQNQPCGKFESCCGKSCAMSSFCHVVKTTPYKVRKLSREILLPCQHSITWLKSPHVKFRNYRRKSWCRLIILARDQNKPCARFRSYRGQSLCHFSSCRDTPEDVATISEVVAGNWLKLQNCLKKLIKTPKMHRKPIQTQNRQGKGPEAPKRD